jgi:kumamolisin
MRNAEGLDDLLARLYTPGDSLYRKYLSVQEFTATFGATDADIEQVEKYFAGLGCAVTNVHENHLLINFECEQKIVERAMGVKISHWQNGQGEMLRTIDKDPSIPADLPIEAIHGLTNSPKHPNFIRASPSPSPRTGTGPNGGLSPSDIKAAYSFNGISADGAGQTLALFELDGYNASDIAVYQSTFGLNPGVPLENILVDGFNGAAGQNSIEDVLDIELMMAIAPRANKILVYEGPNSEVGAIDVYQRIANENRAKVVSTSWGLAENLSSRVVINSESQIFRQMAAQGQSIFAASGDAGAFDDRRWLTVDDPASQPFVTGVGGTSLYTNSSQGYARETTWWDQQRRWGGGGGVSGLWAIPSWQSGVIAPASGGSRFRRNVPDVALDSDPMTGYSIYANGAWAVYGGTSCAAPLWAAFMALVNQQRVSAGRPVIGFVSPTIYRIGKSAVYAKVFHDVADLSSNGYYRAIQRYDLATGWGSLIADALLANLVLQ